jgi:hypothetical protein
MPRIYWDTDCHAPCVGMIVNADDETQTVLVQTDWDYPGVAGTFGWSIREVQADEGVECDHRHTDGTVKCQDCGLTPTDFINAARSFLEDADGATADDPGYFE